MGGNGGSGETGGMGGMGGAAGMGGAGETGGNGTTEEPLGCMCDVVGSKHNTSAMLPALGLAAIFASRRTRRRTR